MNEINYVPILSLRDVGEMIPFINAVTILSGIDFDAAELGDQTLVCVPPANITAARGWLHKLRAYLPGNVLGVFIYDPEKQTVCIDPSFSEYRWNTPRSVPTHYYMQRVEALEMYRARVMPGDLCVVQVPFRAFIKSPAEASREAVAFMAEHFPGLPWRTKNGAEI